MLGHFVWTETLVWVDNDFFLKKGAVSCTTGINQIFFVLHNAH